MSKDPTKKTSASVAGDLHVNLDEQIRRLAYELYELYERRGREDGKDLDDWLSAEAEITGTAAKKAAA